jgi:uncharacterized protein YdeI (YjbR/CyaY-like superfamily)
LKNDLKGSSGPACFKTAAAFRTWLRKNHRVATELLVRLHKKHAADQGITYAEALDEALCHGWIDGVRRGLDDDSFSIRFTPRKPRSIWSRVNVAHIERLKKAGRLMPAGLAAFEAREESRTAIYSFEREAMTLSADLAKRFRADRKAWAFFEKQPPGYQRLNIFRVMSAKREETRIRRLEMLVAWSAKRMRAP